MTESRTDPAALPVEAIDRFDRLLGYLFAARVVLALAAIGLILFLFQWSSAVKRDTVIAPPGQQVPDEWKVVIAEYAGTGRGSGIVALKPWKFGTMAEHPIQVALCIAAVVMLAGAFAVCAWHASRLKRLIESPAPSTKVVGS